MTRKPKTPTSPDAPAEYARFVEAARKLGADESPDALDRAFERVIKRKSPAQRIVLPNRSDATRP